MNRKTTGSMLLALIAMTLGATAFAQANFGQRPRGNAPAQPQPQTAPGPASSVEQLPPQPQNQGMEDKWPY